MEASSILISVIAAVAFLSASHALKVGQICGGAVARCDAGLLCQECVASGDPSPRCSQIVPIDPLSKGMGLPFNKYAWLTTHNSYAQTNRISDTGAIIISPRNQDDTVTEQLKNGVRGLMLDVYDFQNDIWLCHSFGGVCLNYTAFQPAINVLKEIEAFLAANPTAVITIFLEDYVKTPQGLPKLFQAAGLGKYMFPLSRMPQNGTDWPLLDDMIRQNQRLVVFTSQRNKQNAEGIAYEWNYVVENQYGDGGMVVGSCPNRAESSPMNTTGKSLVLMNYFPENPDQNTACKEHSGQLIDMLKTCQKFSGNRWANFIAVDFYKRSNGGGAPLAVDTANGHLVCGCDNIAYCKVNGPFGTCEAPAPELPPAAPPRAAGTQSRTSVETSSSPGKRPIGRRLLEIAALVTATSLFS